ncbi:hypothetical protein [Rhizobium lusitanum]|uniref:hypothetical protein n=1 Tax=Rhizobium lusitanum TaxID=293958 RepID=UPI00195CC1E4|nr:hypothetical protein [Rhizobium lusitanum]MBM7043584.1 hypothetical protein [Rhizobium lusitanum]
MYRTTTEEEREFLALFGLVVMDWNVLEAAIELITYRLAGGGGHIEVLTGHLGALGMNEAMKTLSTEFGPADLRNDIAHLAEMFDRLREYRNYYVHGIRLLGAGGDSGPVIGLSQSTTSKSRLKLHQAIVTKDELMVLSGQLDECKRFADWLTVKLYGIEGPEMPILPRPDTPALPVRLKKPTIFLTDQR